MSGLELRRIDKLLGGGTIHISIDSGPDDRDEFDADETPCCMASAMRGPRACTCWSPVFDLEQNSELELDAPATTRTACCADCAYRNDSPERRDGYTEELVDVASGAHETFACHTGLRRAIAYRHPDGREIPARDGDYQPPIVNGRAYKASGDPAELCAGWSAHRRALLRPDDIAELEHAVDHEEWNR